MNAISKVSEITASDVADYIRLAEPTTDDTNFLTTAISVSKDYILSYTGIKAEDLDKYTDFIIVVLILCQDMYDTRALYVDNANLNSTVDTILGMHRRNLL